MTQNIYSLLVSSLISGEINRDRLQQLLELNFTGDELLRSAMYLNNTLAEVKPEDLPVDVAKMGKISENWRKQWNLEKCKVSVISVDNFRSIVNYRIVGPRKYWFKTQEEADKYSNGNGNSYNGAYYERSGYEFVGEYENTDSGSCSIEVWMEVMKEK